jgi:probable phosphoglycerate mutase
MRLILVRHGRPDEQDMLTPHDPPLNAEGCTQARAVARLLESEGVTRVVASPLQRARQTAEPLAVRLGLPVETIDGWLRFLANPIGYLGSDPTSFQAGVLAALGETIEGEPPAARVAVFAHGLPINIVLSHVLGLDNITRFLVGYGSVTRLRHFGDGRYGVASINETGHHRWRA